MAERIKKMFDNFISKLPKIEKRDDRVLADLLLVNCIDCRYPHAIHKYMHCQRPDDVYDHLVLAGASLASTAVHTHSSCWANTFLEHVAAAIDMHKIRGVLVLDHRDCGAYRKFGLLTDGDTDTQREFDQHEMVAKDALELIAEVFRSKPQPGYLEALLTPNIPLGTSDFPTNPVHLHSISV